MPIDPRAYTIQAPQIANPVDLATSAAKLQELRALGQEHKIELAQKQRAFADDTAIRDAAKQSMTIDKYTGQPVLDRGSYLSKVMAINPLRGQQMALDFGQQDLAKAKQRNEYIGEVMHGINSQESLDQAIGDLGRAGHTVAAQALASYGKFDSNPLSDFQTKMDRAKQAQLSTQQQFELKHQAQEIDIKKTDAQIREKQLQQSHEQFLQNQERESSQFKAGKAQQAREFAAGQALQRESKAQELGMKQAEMEKSRQQFTYGKQQEANQQFAQSVESSRERPNVKTSIADNLQVQKFNEILKPYIDNPKLGNTIQERLDKVPLTAWKLGLQEAAKTSKGGVAGEGEFHELLSPTMKTSWAETMKKLSGNEQPAKAGSQLLLLHNYMNDIGKNAQKVMKDAYFQSLNQHARYMSPEQVEMAQGENFKRFMGGEYTAGKAAETATTGGEHDDALAYARSPNADPQMAARILQLHGFKAEAADILKGKPKAGR